MSLVQMYLVKTQQACLVCERLWYDVKSGCIQSIPPEETDHLGVRIFGNGILDKGAVCNHEPMGFSLVYLELEVLVRGIEFLCIVVYSIDRACLVAGWVNDEQRVSEFSDVLCRCRVVRIAPRIRETIKGNSRFKLLDLREEEHREPSPCAEPGEAELRCVSIRAGLECGNRGPDHGLDLGITSLAAERLPFGSNHREPVSGDAVGHDFISRLEPVERVKKDNSGVFPGESRCCNVCQGRSSRQR